MPGVVLAHGASVPEALGAVADGPFVVPRWGDGRHEARPDRTADERTQLLGWFDLQRGIVRLKCEGLSDEDAHRVVVPTSPLMTVAGIVSHLRWCEELWFREVLLGQPGVGRGYGPLADDIEDAEFLVEGIPLATLLQEYDDECARSDAAIAGARPGRCRQHRPCTRWARHRCAGSCCTCSRRPPGTPATST